MAHSLLLRLLAPALLVLVARAEYGARMPAYDDDPALDRDDYHAHSPEAPAQLDYKYEEDIKAKIELSSDGDGRRTDSWQRPDRKKRKRTDDDDDRLDDFDKFDAEENFQKPKLNTHLTKHRPRLKSRKFDRSDEDIHKYSRTVRDRSDYRPEFKIDEETHLDKDDFGDESMKSVESDDNIQLAYRTSSVRAPRRRPRDRYVKKAEEEEDDVIGESGIDRDLEMWRLDKKLSGHQLDQDVDQDRRRLGASSHTQELMLRQHAVPTPYVEVPERDIMDEPPAFGPLKGESRIRPQSQYEDEDNNDYYDMKRVLNKNKKLPTNMRRTGAPLRLVPAPSVRSFEEMLANRRMLRPTTTTSSPFRTTNVRTTTFKSTTITTPMITIATRTTTLSTMTTPMITTVTIKTKALVNTTASKSKELSLAEKSRLSILKKAQRKEDLREERQETKKPPVLLQVTSKIPTVVMVEPPSSQEPWMRARPIENDSPQRLRKVKKLMRTKLLENARSIHDLTDNWDDLVCDYVDMSLLDNGAPHTAEPLRAFFTAITLLITFAIH